MSVAESNLDGIADKFTVLPRKLERSGEAGRADGEGEILHVAVEVALHEAAHLHAVVERHVPTFRLDGNVNVVVCRNLDFYKKEVFPLEIVGGCLFKLFFLLHK